MHVLFGYNTDIKLKREIQKLPSKQLFKLRSVYTKIITARQIITIVD